MAHYAYYDQMDAYHAQQAVVNNYRSPYTGDENHHQQGSRTYYASGHKRSHSRRPESPSGPRVFRQLNGTTEAAAPQSNSNSKRYLYSNAVRAPNGSSQGPSAIQEERPNPKQILAKVGLSCSSKSELGSGRYSRVLRATYVATKTKMAVKVIDLSTVTPEFRDKFLPREIESWKRVRHVNICSLYQEFQSKDYQFLIMELADHGDMLTHVQQNGAIPEPQALEWMRQLMSGVDHLHRLSICHRDLKLENVLLFKHGIVKLADFGFAREISSRELSSTYCGSKSYSAPEILKGIHYDAFKADVWSLGVVAFVMCTNQMPFREDVAHNSIIVNAQRNRDYRYPSKNRLSPACRYTIDRMLTFEPVQRPTILECCSLPWFLGSGHVPQTHHN